MSNKWPKCPTCLLRHRPGKCKGKAGHSLKLALNGIDWQSSPIIAEGIASFFEEMADKIRKLREGV